MVPREREVCQVHLVMDLVQEEALDPRDPMVTPDPVDTVEPRENKETMAK